MTLHTNSSGCRTPASSNSAFSPPTSSSKLLWLSDKSLSPPSTSKLSKRNRSSSSLQSAKAAELQLERILFRDMTLTHHLEGNEPLLKSSIVASRAKSSSPRLARFWRNCPHKGQPCVADICRAKIFSQWENLTWYSSSITSDQLSKMYWQWLQRFSGEWTTAAGRNREISRSSKFILSVRTVRNCRDYSPLGANFDSSSRFRDSSKGVAVNRLHEMLARAVKK